MKAPGTLKDPKCPLRESVDNILKPSHPPLPPLSSHSLPARGTEAPVCHLYQRASSLRAVDSPTQEDGDGKWIQRFWIWDVTLGVHVWFLTEMCLRTSSHDLEVWWVDDLPKFTAMQLEHIKRQGTNYILLGPALHSCNPSTQEA
jgi:hypothetical protein